MSPLFMLNYGIYKGNIAKNLIFKKNCLKPPRFSIGCVHKIKNIPIFGLFFTCLVDFLVLPPGFYRLKWKIWTIWVVHTSCFPGPQHVAYVMHVKYLKKCIKWRKPKFVDFFYLFGWLFGPTTRLLWAQMKDMDHIYCAHNFFSWSATYSACYACKTC